MRALLLLLVLAACSGDGEGHGPAKGEGKRTVDPRTLVEVATVGPGSVGDHIGASAVIESEAEATVVPETQGVVTALHAEEGDAVRKGQLLAVLASPTLDAAYQRASAELERARADAAAAERLHAQGAIARSELDVATRALAAARTAHEEASRTRGFTRLESPIDGIVASRALRYGELAGGQPAFTIVDPARLRVVLSLPERDLARVRAGLVAQLESAYDAAVTGSGVVERTAPVVDPRTGTFRVTVRLDPPKEGATPLRPGQFARVRIEVDRREGVLVLPRRALVWEEGKAYAYTVVETTKEAEEAAAKDAGDEAGGEEAKDEEGGFSLGALFGGDEDEKDDEPELPGPWRKATRVEVQVGFEDGELAEVRGGLAAGAAVVTVGNQALRDGARVRLPDDPVLAPEKEGDKPADGAADATAGAEGG